MREIVDWIQDFIIGIFVIIGVIGTVFLCYVSIDIYKKAEHNPVITVSKSGYLVIDGDTTKYVLKEVKAYKMERRERDERNI